MRRRPAFPDLASAVEWLTEVWTERETPLRLHTSDHDGFGLMFAPAFARRLDATPDDKAWITEQRDCRHHRVQSGSVFACPDCAGSGTYKVTIWAWRYPTWRAMVRLASDNRVAHDVVLTLVINGFDTAGSCKVLGISERGLLAAIRSLHHQYQLQPDQRVAWTERSESQQRAEDGLLMAAAGA